MSKLHYGYSTKEIKEKIRCPQLGSDDYGEWASLPLWARFVIDDLLQMVEHRDKAIEDIIKENY